MKKNYFSITFRNHSENAGNQGSIQMQISNWHPVQPNNVSWHLPRTEAYGARLRHVKSLLYLIYPQKIFEEHYFN